MEVLNNIKTAILGPITAEDLQGKSKLTLAVFEDTVKELTEINVKAIARQQEQADIMQLTIDETIRPSSSLQVQLKWVWLTTGKTGYLRK